MASGFFLGGMAPGILEGSQSVSNSIINAAKMQSLAEMQIAQQQSNQKHADYMSLLSRGVDHLGETIKQLKNAHPDWTDLQIASNPAVVGLKQTLSTFKKNLKLPDDTDAQVAAFAAGPSEIQTARMKAEATGTYGKEQAQTFEANQRGLSLQRGGMPDPNYNPDKPGLPQNGPALGDKTAQATETDVGNKPLPPIPTPMTHQQEQIVGAAGFTPATADFEAVKAAYGADIPPARSKVGGYASNIIRSRADQYWIDRGVDPQSANAIRVEFKAMQHGATKIADIDARMTTAVNKAQQTAQILTGESGQNLIGSVSRTKYKDLNDLLVAARERTGDQNEIRLGIALETLASNYGTALGMGNSTLTDFQTKRAQSLLQQGWDKGQLTAAIDQLQKEMVREEAGSRQALKTYIGGMQSTIKGTGVGSDQPSQSGGDFQPVPGMPGATFRQVQ